MNNVLTEHGHSPVKEDHEKIRDLGILVDADDEGYLLQLFTCRCRTARRCSSRSSAARGSQSFGKGNAQALFERWSWSRTAAGTCEVRDRS